MASGAVPNALLRAADHEADLLAHPYTGVEHLELARLRLPDATPSVTLSAASWESGCQRGGGGREAVARLCAGQAVSRPKPPAWPLNGQSAETLTRYERGYRPDRRAPR